MAYDSIEPIGREPLLIAQLTALVANYLAGEEQAEPLTAEDFLPIARPDEDGDDPATNAERLKRKLRDALPGLARRG